MKNLCLQKMFLYLRSILNINASYFILFRFDTFTSILTYSPCVCSNRYSVALSLPPFILFSTDVLFVKMCLLAERKIYMIDWWKTAVCCISINFKQNIFYGMFFSLLNGSLQRKHAYLCTMEFVNKFEHFWLYFSDDLRE